MHRFYDRSPDVVAPFVERWCALVELFLSWEINRKAWLDPKCGTSIVWHFSVNGSLSVHVEDPESLFHGRTGERVGDDLDHDGKPYVTVLLDGDTFEVALDPSTLVEITPEGERHRITAYDLHIEVRHAGESTYAEGWVEFDGERHHLVVASSSSDRGTTYILDGETHWWSEIRWLDEWFEGLWMDAAAEAGYRLDNEIDFDRSMRSEERSGE
jgi:hypothetical protein